MRCQGLFCSGLIIGLLFIVAGLLFSETAEVAAEPTVSAQAESHPPEPAKPGFAFKLKEGIHIDVQSKPVTWNKQPVHLVGFHRARFQLSGDPTPRLTAEITGRSVTFDQVHYRVSGAVYDKNNTLLGAASTDLDVERIWLGQCLTQPAKLTLDFGRSQAWDRAARFELVISEMPVLTPEQWMGKE